MGMHRGPIALLLQRLTGAKATPEIYQNLTAATKINVSENKEFIDNWYMIMDLLPHQSAHRPSSHYSYVDHKFCVDESLFALQRHKFVSHFMRLWKNNKSLIKHIYSIYAGQQQETVTDIYELIQRSNSTLTGNNYEYYQAKQYQELTGFFDRCYKYHSKRINHDIGANNKSNHDDKILDGNKGDNHYIATY